MSLVSKGLPVCGSTGFVVMSKISVFTRFLYGVDDMVDNVLNAVMDCFDLSDVKYDLYTVTLRFGDKIIMELWNSGKYYAWLSKGKVLVGGNELFFWREARPRRKTMNRVLGLIESFVDDRLAPFRK